MATNRCQTVLIQQKAPSHALWRCAPLRWDSGSKVDATTVSGGESGGADGCRCNAHAGTTGKRYRVATEDDLAIFREAEAYLAEKREKLTLEWGMDAVPDEPLRRVPLTFGVINVWVYGMNTWGDLFNARQKLALITFVEKVKDGVSKDWWRKGLMGNMRRLW